MVFQLINEFVQKIQVMNQDQDDEQQFQIIYTEYFFFRKSIKNKYQITCLNDMIMLEEYLHMIYHEYDLFYQYLIIEEEMQLMNHLKMMMHLIKNIKILFLFKSLLTFHY